MFTPAMHGPVALTLFWIWLGVVATGLGGYWLLQNHQKKKKEKDKDKEEDKPPAKYSEQLRQRLQKKPPPPRITPAERGNATRKRP
jgi:cytoskeletal protein RodZ